MKTLKYLFVVIAVSGMVIACDTTVESLDIKAIEPYTYSPLYYQNLRDYKASDHEIAFGWFAQYGSQTSAAIRFTGLPDSLDICSMWGGIPDEDETDIWEDIRFTQKVKGTKMLCVSITRIDAESDEYEFKQVYDSARATGDDSLLYRSIEMYAEYFLDKIFLNDLDGFDADYEPEGDFLSGSYFMYFMQYLAKYMGPNPDITGEDRLKLIQERYGTEQTDTNKLLCVDSNGQASSSLSSICNYYFVQAYGGGTSTYGWPAEKVVLCCNMGDGYTSSMSGMYTQARYEPSTGHKGGFGEFFINRDYFVNEYNPEPYYRTRQCIQIQNPAIY